MKKVYTNSKGEFVFAPKEAWDLEYYIALCNTHFTMEGRLAHLQEVREHLRATTISSEIYENVCKEEISKFIRIKDDITAKEAYEMLIKHYGLDSRRYNLSKITDDVNIWFIINPEETNLKNAANLIATFSQMQKVIDDIDVVLNNTKETKMSDAKEEVKVEETLNNLKEEPQPEMKIDADGFYVETGSATSDESKKEPEVKAPEKWSLTKKIATGAAVIGVIGGIGYYLFGRR